MQLQHTVKGLKDAPSSAVTEIKSPEEEHEALKEPVNLLESGRRKMESKVQEELRQKDELTRKRQAHTKAHTGLPVAARSERQ